MTDATPAPEVRRADGEPLTELDRAAVCFADPKAYADEPRWFAAAALLRSEAPVHRLHLEGLPPFHVVTRHADVFEISTHADAFRNEPRAILQTLEMEELLRAQGDLKTLIHIDDPATRSCGGSPSTGSSPAAWAGWRSGSARWPPTPSTGGRRPTAWSTWPGRSPCRSRSG